MTHLGDRVTDLVDGQLGPEATERAHAHLARCTQCRVAVEAERLMKSRLASLPGPQPAADLVGRLLAIGTPPGDVVPRPAVPGETAVPVAARVPAGAAGRPRSGRPVGSRPAGRSARDAARPEQGRWRPARRRRLAVAVAGALSVVGAAGLTFSATSMMPTTVVPTVATFLVEQTATTRDLPFVDVPAGWVGDDEPADR